MENKLTTQQRELQPKELKPSKDGKKNLSLALQSLRIDRCADADIEIVLKYVMMKLGIRAKNLPTREEKILLLNHIKENFFTHTTGEIRLAFELAINYELDLTIDEVNCYENFSCAYFSKIMRAFRVWASEQIKTETSPPPAQKIYTEEELDNFHRQWTEEFYQQLRRGHIKEIPDYVMNILKKDKLLKEGISAMAFLVYKLGVGAEHIYEHET